MLSITTYREKVIDDLTCPPFFTKVLKSEYIIDKTVKISGTLQELKDRLANNKRIIINDDNIIEDMGTIWGIHSYHLIEEVKNEL